MSTVRLIRRPRSIDTHSGVTSVLAVGYEDKMIAYVDKTGQLLPVGMYEGTSCCPLSLQIRASTAVTDVGALVL